jgi:hypothetical protein
VGAEYPVTLRDLGIFADQAISAGSLTRFIGDRLARKSRCCRVPELNISVAVPPGATALMRMLRVANSRPALFVRRDRDRGQRSLPARSQAM